MRFENKTKILCKNALAQGCQMVFFQTKNPKLGQFWRALQWKMLINFMDIWYFCVNLVHPVLVN
jgi:hypothetical protein